MTTIELETVEELIDELRSAYTTAGREALGNAERSDFEDYAETVGARAALTQLKRRLEAEVDATTAEALIDEMAAAEEADARKEMDAEARAERRAEKAREEGRW